MRRTKLTGESLTIEELVFLVRNPTSLVEVPNKILRKISKVRVFLENEIRKRIVYGVNTGFGPMASHIINPKNLDQLQENLVVSHAVGMGAPVASSYVLASMLVRLNTLAKGYSGVTRELLERLQFLVNNRIIPIVPEHGAVGTSGDLVQLAHMALPFLGKGDVQYAGKMQSSEVVLKKFGLKPYRLKPKEGLSLINGTSFMSGVAALVAHDAEQVLGMAARTGALALEMVAAFDDSISETLHELRPHNGQKKIAKVLRFILSTSKMLRKRVVLDKKNGHIEYDVQEIPDDVQEIYSIRCISQILGPVLDTLFKTREDIETEINSVSDNPIVDWKSKQFLHGGNFHGDVVAASMDQLKTSMVKLTILSERRINFFLNHRINRLLPPFLNLKKPGLTLALQGLQFVATSTTAQSQSLAYPHHVHSIPTNGDNQDVVSMGTDAALMTGKVVENASYVLAIELITLSQAVEIRDIRSRLSLESRKLIDAVRNALPPITDDRVLTEELPRVIELVHDEKFSIKF